MEANHTINRAKHIREEFSLKCSVTVQTQIQLSSEQEVVKLALKMLQKKLNKSEIWKKSKRKLFSPKFKTTFKMQ